jgi:MYXO-CTERM domain-containing protein
MRPLLIALTALLLLPTSAEALCPAAVPIIDQLSCSSEITTTIDWQAGSLLGGTCANGECYACGTPYANQEQLAPEAVYSFGCQKTGNVLLTITNLPCDLDIYVLDSSCDPYTGCVEGSTASYAVDDSVAFTCTSGQLYYVVIEAYGTAHLNVASGPCTDDGTATGDVFSPDYTLSFDVSQSTGCAEDCDDGLDNDLDNITDCADPDCALDTVCCDLDEDGFFGAQCSGPDCDDSDPAVHPGAPEVVNGIDDDCDGDTDEGSDVFDDDGDGFSEQDGDCNDANAAIHPDAVEIPGNSVDDDCDGVTDEDDDGIHDGDGDGYTESEGDCDDTDPAVHPGAPEVVGNGIDDDCDGLIDEDDDGTVDDDGDGYSEADGDCDDTDPAVHPGAPEILGNGIDDDCDGLIDEDDEGVVDDDGDGFTEQDGDCDDDNPSVNPYADEDPTNGIDDDCDGEIDEVDEPADDDDSAPADDDDLAPPSDTGDDDDSTMEPPSFGCACRAGATSPDQAWLAPLLMLVGALRRRRA